MFSQWPYSYDECDVGTLANQTLNGEPAIATTSGPEGLPGEGALSFLPGQRLSRCVCPSDSSHPGPKHDDETWVGRSAPEIGVSRIRSLARELFSYSLLFFLLVSARRCLRGSGGHFDVDWSRIAVVAVGSVSCSLRRLARNQPNPPSYYLVSNLPPSSRIRFNPEYTWLNNSANLIIDDPEVSALNTYFGGEFASFLLQLDVSKLTHLFSRYRCLPTSYFGRFRDESEL